MSGGPSFVVVLPAIDPVLTTACIESMAPECRDRTLLIDNTQTGEIARRHARHVMFNHAPHKNLGVGPSWNQGIELARAMNADFLVILSQSIRFRASGGMDFIAELETRRPPVLMHSQHGWKFLALARATWERVGLFDVEYYPAYMEDTSYLYRMHLAGLPSPRENDGTLDGVVIDAVSAGDAQTLRRGHVTVDFTALTALYVARWGGAPTNETYTRPFNDPTLDWTYIGPRPVRLEETG